MAVLYGGCTRLRKKRAHIEREQIILPVLPQARAAKNQPGVSVLFVIHCHHCFQRAFALQFHGKTMSSFGSKGWNLRTVMFSLHISF